LYEDVCNDRKILTAKFFSIGFQLVAECVFIRYVVVLNRLDYHLYIQTHVTSLVDLQMTKKNAVSSFIYI